MSKILIVDDDRDVLELLKMALESKGYQVIAANSGEEGLQKVTNENPNLIILDVMMETGDKGFDVARKIKKNNNYKNIPILILTAIKEKTSFDFQNQAGNEDWLPVECYLDKSLKLEQIICKIEELLH